MKAMTEYDLTISDNGRPQKGEKPFFCLAKSAQFNFAEIIAYVDESETTTEHHLDNISDAGSALAWCVSVALESQSAADLLMSLPLDNWTIKLSNSDSGYSFDLEEQTLSLGLDEQTIDVLKNSAFLRETVFNDFLYALRDIWFELYTQEAAEDLSPESYLLWERFRQADIASFSILVAWEILNMGDASFWRHATEHENGDMALAFIHRLTRNESIFENPLDDARWQAFKVWYRERERLTFCDRRSLDYMDDLLAEMGPCAFGTSRFSTAFIQKISGLTGFQNYIGDKAKDLSCAPEFSIMPDEISQTHLMHIMNDLTGIQKSGVTFRDKKLAHLIFPDTE